MDGTSLRGIYFDGSNDFRVFYEKLENYFIRESIDGDEKKRATLLTLVSDEVYKLVESLCVPDKLSDAKYVMLTKMMLEHYAPSKSYFSTRHKLYSARRAREETAREWAARLKGLAADCKYGDEFKIIVRDLFVSGYGEGPIQDRLFEEDPSKPSLTLAALVDIATGKESAMEEKRQRSSIAIKSEPADVFSVRQRKRGKVLSKSVTSERTEMPIGCRHYGRRNTRLYCSTVHPRDWIELEVNIA